MAILLPSIVLGDVFDEALSFLDVGGDFFSSAGFAYVIGVLANGEKRHYQIAIGWASAGCQPR